jgi:hypothetical protein
MLLLRGYDFEDRTTLKLDLYQYHMEMKFKLCRHPSTQKTKLEVVKDRHSMLTVQDILS